MAAELEACLPPLPPSEPTYGFVDNLIEILLATRQAKTRTPINLEEGSIVQLLHAAKGILLEQPTLIELDAPINICGDIHGQYYDLIRHFEMAGFPSEDNPYLFLGDYVDRAQMSVETACLLLCYKIKFPVNFFLLRGNHECASINRTYGFYDECKRRYSVKLWRRFGDVFNCLPIAAVVAERILCMHGGLSPSLHRMEQLLNVRRPFVVPDAGLVTDILWADPDAEVSGWRASARGISYTFGRDILERFLQQHNFDLVCRAHQVVEDGYEFFSGRKLVTIFSAPNYCNEFDNAGGMMVIDANLHCSFRVLLPQYRKRK